MHQEIIAYYINPQITKINGNISFLRVSFTTNIPKKANMIKVNRTNKPVPFLL